MACEWCGDEETTDPICEDCVKRAVVKDTPCRACGINKRDDCWNKCKHLAAYQQALHKRGSGESVGVVDIDHNYGFGC